MKKFVVFNVSASNYMPEKDNELKFPGGVAFGKARLFQSAAGARQAAKRWCSDFQIRPVNVSLDAMPIPSAVPDVEGVLWIPFRDVVKFFRSVYSIDFTKAVGEYSQYLYNIPLLPYLEAHNGFLGGLSNGDKIIVRLKDFQHAHPAWVPMAKELVEQFGLPDAEGVPFCPFIIDWKGANSDY